MFEALENSVTNLGFPKTLHTLLLKKKLTNVHLFCMILTIGACIAKKRDTPQFSEPPKNRVFGEQKWKVDASILTSQNRLSPRLKLAMCALMLRAAFLDMRCFRIFLTQR